MNEIIKLNEMYNKLDKIGEEVLRRKAYFDELNEPIEKCRAGAKRKIKIFCIWFIIPYLCPFMLWVGFGLCYLLDKLGFKIESDSDTLAFAIPYFIFVIILWFIINFLDKQSDKRKLKKLLKKNKGELERRNASFIEIAQLFLSENEKIEQQYPLLSEHIPDAFHSSEGIKILVYYINERCAESVKEAVSMYYQDQNNKQIMNQLNAQTVAAQKTATSAQLIAGIEVVRGVRSLLR